MLIYGSKSILYQVTPSATGVVASSDNERKKQTSLITLQHEARPSVSKSTTSTVGESLFGWDRQFLCSIHARCLPRENRALNTNSKPPPLIRETEVAKYIKAAINAETKKQRLAQEQGTLDLGALCLANNYALYNLQTLTLLIRESLPNYIVVVYVYGLLASLRVMWAQ